MKSKTVFLGIGSNLGDRHFYLNKAIALLKKSGAIGVISSSFYETEPIDCPIGSQSFLNAVLTMQWNEEAESLLTILQDIEKSLGRKRTVKNAPREMDLDILLFGDTIIQSARLNVPHPRIKKRYFVLEPLAELAPDLIMPNEEKSVQQLLQQLLGVE